MTAGYSGDSIYASATSSPLSETVYPGTASMTLSGVLEGENAGVDSVLYSFQVSGVLATPTGSVTVSDNAADSCSATLDGTGSGNCTLLETAADGPFIVSGSYAGDSNYNPATASPTPSVTVTDDAASVETGGSVVFTATVAGAGPVVTPGGTVSWALSGETSLGTPSCADSSLADGIATCTISGVDATTYTATVTYGGDANYAAGASGSDDTADVGPAPLYVTASSGSFTYGGTPPTITASYEGFQNGDSVDDLSTAATCSTTATSSSPVADSPYASSCSGAVDPNYTISYSPGSVVVNPAALTVTASDESMTYGGTPPAITASYVGFVNGDSSSSLTTAPRCSTAATSHSSVADSPYGSSCSGAVDPNYTISYSPGSVVVNPASLTVTASDGSMTYGGTPPTITASYAGFKNGDTASDLTTAPSCSTRATSKSTVPQLPVSVVLLGSVRLQLHDQLHSRLCDHRPGAPHDHGF